MKILNKKSFTLIELMVSITIGLILLNFVFSFQFNFMKELEFLKAKEKLAMESFKLMEVSTKGLNYNQYTIPGIICAASIHGGNKFKIHGSNDFWRFDRSGDFMKFDNYIYRHVQLNSNVNIQKVKDDGGATVSGLYSIKYDSQINQVHTDSNISNPRYSQYKRLIYAK